MAAAGHNGDSSACLVRHFAEDLGYDYMCASGKSEYVEHLKSFLSPQMTGRPMIFEVFTDSELESQALEMTLNCMVDKAYVLKKHVGNAIKGIIK
jgi:2-succinyl-5-enolpyruvyl-6-hydroxy-3-cyclohexene-1-carboxylate synthase